MAASAVFSVARTIGNLLVDEAKILWDVDGKLKDLHNELRLICCLMKDADAKKDNPSIQECIAQLQDIAYDAEDVIEQYILRVSLGKRTNIIKAHACFMAKCRCVRAHVVGTEIDFFKSSVWNLGQRMMVYGIQPLYEPLRNSSRRTYRQSEDFVGREGNIEELVNELLNDGKEQRVIFIWGMGGLGKTVLTEKVFSHEKVETHFDGVAWVCLSQESRGRHILEIILVKLIPNQRERVRYMRDEELCEALYMRQKEKRCLVVLDDIWTKQAWDEIRIAFPIKNTRSKLLITTRIKEVAQHIDPHGLFHELQGLSELESWDLLKKVAHLETKEINEKMKTSAYKLLKNCGGLPLAINVLGKLLASSDWETIDNKINLHISDESDVSKVLALSYDELPWHLKQCFLHLGSFPEGAKILATEVLHMWIAEGFVHPDTYDEKREIQVEDAAELYLMELVDRGMVQVRFNSSGKIKTLHLHKLMRDLCLSKALQEKFLSILTIHRDNEMKDYSSLMAVKDEPTCKIRRLSLNMHMSAERDFFSIIKSIERTALHLRTFMFFRSAEAKYKQFQPIIINCKLLRVLKLEDLSWMGGNIPESVGDLVHLRFLSLARSEFKRLPQSIGNLVLMEFLDLRVDSYVVVIVPNVLWKMRRLRHLHLPSHFVVKEKFYGDRKKLRLDTLKTLWTLRNFGSKNCDVNDLRKLTNLRKLIVSKQHGFNGLEIIPQLVEFKLKHLQTSSFRFSSLSFTESEMSKMSSYPHLCKLFMRGKIEKLPDHVNLPQHLRKLVLVYSYLKEDPMPTLERLHNLMVLLLGNWAFVGKEMVCSRGGFPQLEHLVLDGLPNLEEWRIAEGAIPHLSRLGIGYCPNIGGVAVREGVFQYDSYEYMVDEYWMSSHRRTVNRESNN